MHTVTLIPGDGIGTGISEAAIRVVEETGVNVRWERYDAGTVALEKYRDPLPKEVLESIQRNKVALKGPITTPIGSGFRSVNVALRQAFDLYANLRPAKSLEGVKSRYKNIDIIVVRENTEGLYVGIEHYIHAEKGTPGAAESMALITRHGSERIARFAFEYAQKNKRKKVTIAHKANILKHSQGLFLNTCREVAQQYPDIECDDRIIDNTAMQLVMDPREFDVIVTTNMFGDILSELTAGLIGGLGLAPGANVGVGTAVFEAVHGSAPDIAGKNLANPSAIILAAAMMLDYLGEVDAARKIEAGVAAVIKEGQKVTRDLNPERYVGSTEMTEAIFEKLHR
ncbi:MAG: isocitrate/isopropylmalate dehydrogenase family protein [Bacteroidota bacterium]